jgi:hypothetical protein
VDGAQFARSVQPGELFGVAPVGFLPRAFFLRGLGRCDHDRIDLAFQEPAMDHKAGRPSFINEVQPDLFATELGQQFFQRMQVVTDLPVRANFAQAATFGDGDGDRIFVDIQPDIFI